MNDTTSSRQRYRRGARDWVVDSLMFLTALGFGLLGVVTLPGEPPPPVPPDPLRVTEQLVALACCTALWWRRRWPVGIAVVLVAASAVSQLAMGAMLVALFSLCVHRPPRVGLTVLGLSFLASYVGALVHPDPHGTPVVTTFLLSAVFQGAAAGWGLSVQHRRQLFDSLRERAAHAEAEAQLRAEQAQHRVRESIAREIHDVLGHRLSLLSVHAGALEYRPNAPAEEVARSAGVIRESAHQALQDLREVIGVLRAPVGELPQPTMADLSQLVTEAGDTGAGVDLVEEYSGEVPERTGRTAYRIVQEGLTNARKHASGARTSVRISGSPGRGLNVEVGNGPAVHDPEAVTEAPGGGQGLVGLAERVSLASGRLEYGPTADGGWRLSAWLPWPS
ncbi:MULTISPECIES: sensor histidine kinase [unclassified Nocardiopsis]|uniref:sensor histidine kinase n=1 Tax=unclassified Nocardiopsis TaxID=2649073 RepID=UPI00066C1299|nr:MULTISPECIES: histidine kinase [unclassified Nocardiopsis]MBQ1080056.1 two-component sensor histidine kinase [Nocardiopsis sp. B62]